MIALLFGLLASPMQTAERVQVALVWNGKDCDALAGGERIPAADLEFRARSWAREGRAVSVTGLGDVPDRCIGATIDRLQSAGLRDVAFGSAKVVITMPRGQCRVAVNDRLVTFRQLRREAKAWAKTPPNVHFMPAPDADYRCVDRVLHILRDASVTKLGFIGNEQPPEDQQ